MISSDNSGNSGRKALDEAHIRIPSRFVAAVEEAGTDVVAKLEEKRRHLDDQVTQFIAGAQECFDDYCRELLDEATHGRESQSVDNGSSSTNRTQTHSVSQRVDDSASKLRKEDRSKRPGSPLVPPDRSPTYGGERSPRDDREMELAGFFTPHFLPLLEATASPRSNSTSAITTIKDIAANEAPDTASKVGRSVSVPEVKPEVTRKSALRTGKVSKRRKRVSLSIDAGIVRPADEPQDQAPITPTDDGEGSQGPNIAITDKDGNTVYVWVPEKARLPLPDEDPIDYVIAVNGILHDTLDTPNEQLPLRHATPSQYTNPITSTNYRPFDWSPAHEHTEFIDPQLMDQGNHEKPFSPMKSTFSPPASPSVAIRHPPTYIDNFTSTSHRIHSPLDGPSPKLEQVGLPTDSGGPSTSYVGGIGGSSGVDAMDIGSVGYPSSLGASYMEQFAAARSFGGRIKNGDDMMEDKEAGRKQVVKDAREEAKVAESDEFLGEMDEL